MDRESSTSLFQTNESIPETPTEMNAFPIENTEEEIGKEGDVSDVWNEAMISIDSDVGEPDEDYITEGDGEPSTDNIADEIGAPAKEREEVVTEEPIVGAADEKNEEFDAPVGEPVEEDISNSSQEVGEENAPECVKVAANEECPGNDGGILKANSGNTKEDLENDTISKINAGSHTQASPNGNSNCTLKTRKRKNLGQRKKTPSKTCVNAENVQTLEVSTPKIHVNDNDVGGDGGKSINGKPIRQSKKQRIRIEEDEANKYREKSEGENVKRLEVSVPNGKDNDAGNRGTSTVESQHCSWTLSLRFLLKRAFFRLCMGVLINPVMCAPPPPDIYYNCGTFDILDTKLSFPDSNFVIKLDEKEYCRPLNGEQYFSCVKDTYLFLLNNHVVKLCTKDNGVADFIMKIGRTTVSSSNPEKLSSPMLRYLQDAYDYNRQLPPTTTAEPFLTTNFTNFTSLGENTKVTFLYLLIAIALSAMCLGFVYWCYKRSQDGLIDPDHQNRNVIAINENEVNARIEKDVE